MESLIKKLKDFINKRYCMLTLAVSIVFSTLITLTEVTMKLFKFDASGIKILNTSATKVHLISVSTLIMEL